MAGQANAASVSKAVTYRALASASVDVSKAVTYRALSQASINVSKAVVYYALRPTTINQVAAVAGAGSSASAVVTVNRAATGAPAAGSGAVASAAVIRLLAASGGAGSGGSVAGLVSQKALVAGSIAVAGVEEFRDMVLASFPRGAAWDGGPNTTFRAFATGLGAVQSYVHSRVATLTEVEANPATSSELLDRWTSVFGLPDPCMGPNPTAASLRAALAAKGAMQAGGQSPAYLISVAAAMGVAITIETFKPFLAGQPCGRRVYGAQWRSVWRIHAPPTPMVAVFRAGSRAGEQLRTFGDSSLECRLTSIAPAFIQLQFAYDLV